jgi:hypothetical protein
MTDPPSDTPAVHCKPKADAVLSAVSSIRLIGASGLVITIAPLPASDTIESPLELVATTLAKMLSP